MNNPTAFLQQENARLKDENDTLRRQVADLREFVAILDHLSNAKAEHDAELLPLLEDIMSQAMLLLDAPDGTLALHNTETDELVFVIVHGALSKDLQGYCLPATEGIAGWVLQNAQPALVRDVRRDERFFADVDDQFKYRTLSLAAAPLIGDGRVLGVVEVLNQPGDEPFSEEDMALLKLMCRFAGEALADVERRKPDNDNT